MTLGTRRAAAEVPPADGAPSASEPPRVEPPPEPRARSPWPELAAVFPGLIVHGSGVWLQKRDTTAGRLLILQGAGVGTTLLSGLLLFQTGAARDWVGPLALTSVAGVGTLGLSFAANLYATWAPPDGFGEPMRALPVLESRVGYLYVFDPQFEYRHFLTTSIEGRVGPVLIGFDGAHSPDQGNRRFDLTLGYRVLGLGSQPASAKSSSSARADGSYLELRAVSAEHRFDTDGFLSYVLGVEAQGRLDAHHYLPDVRGAFFQVGAGYARQWFAFELPQVDTTTGTDLLLAHMGFGIYLGNRPSAAGQPALGGELELYYDHRHDGFANGLKVRGLGSGPAGHVGAFGSYFFTPHWGLSSRMELGSAWCFGLNLVMRAGLR